MLWLYGCPTRGVFKHLCTCMLFMLFVHPLWAMEGQVSLVLNGSEYAVHSFEDLQTFGYPILAQAPYELINLPEVINGYPIGITLDELFPLMVDVWELSIGDKDYVRRIVDPELAEKFNHFAVVIGILDAAGSFTALPDNIDIEIEGEVSTDRSMEIWVSWEGVDRLKAEIERFATLHEVNVKTLEVPKISSKLVQTQRGGGNVPDVVMVQSDYVEELVGSDSIQSMEYFDLDGFNHDGIESFNLYGIQWAIPFYFDTQALICNEYVFTKVGINPESIRTIEDLEQTAIAIRDYATSHNASIIPMSWNLYSAYWFLPFQLGFGKGHLIEADGMVTVADRASIEAMEYLRSLIDKSLLSANERDSMLTNFVSGKIGMIMSASYMIPELEKYGVPFKIIPFPLNQATDTFVTPLSDYKGLAITKRSRNPIIARRLVQYLTGAGVQYRFTSAVDKLPVVEMVSDLDWFESDVRKAVKQSALQGKPIPPDRAYSIYKNVMWSMMRLILDDKLSSHAGLVEAERLIGNQINDYLEQLPNEYRSYYKQSKGDTDDEWDHGKNIRKEVDDFTDTAGGHRFFTWLRSLW